MKILMICLGNICRSPLAHGILEHLSNHKNLDWEIDSCGTSSWHIGNPPDSRSQAVALKHGIDLSTQRARQIKKNDLQYYDLLVTMDQSNYQNVRQMATEAQKDKIYLLNNFAKPGRNEAVIDPYYDDALFESVFKQIYTACEAIIQKYTS